MLNQALYVKDFSMLSDSVRFVGMLQNSSLVTSRGVNAILNSDLKYEARYSGELNDYICQSFG